MFLFTIMAIMVVFLTVFIVVTTSAVGAVGIVVFSDVIVCIAIIGALMHLIIKKRKNK